MTALHYLIDVGHICVRVRQRFTLLPNVIGLSAVVDLQSSKVPEGAAQRGKPMLVAATTCSTTAAPESVGLAASGVGRVASTISEPYVLYPTSSQLMALWASD